MNDSKKLDLLLSKINDMENKFENRFDKIENRLDKIENELSELHNDDELILSEVERVHEIMLKKTSELSKKIS